MRCKACNRVMQPNEIKWNELIGGWEVCGTCLGIVRDLNETLEIKSTEYDYEYNIILKIGFQE